jgi:hypothetical protein
MPKDGSNMQQQQAKWVKSPEILLLLDHLLGWHSVLNKPTCLLFWTVSSIMVKLKLCLHTSRKYVESSTHSLELDRDERSASWHARFTPKERAPDTIWIGSWVGPRPTVDASAKREISYLSGNRTIRPRSSACSLVIISSKFSRYLFSKQRSWYITSTWTKSFTQNLVTNYNPGVQIPTTRQL